MPRTSRPLSIFPISLRDVVVTGIEDVSPHMRRLTVSGEQLAGGERDGHPIGPFRSDGFDDHVKLVVPEPGGPVPAAGTQEGDRFGWAPGVLPLTRDYTVRRYDPAARSLEIDVVRHDAGRASDWAFSCTIGSPLAFAGPKSSAGVNHDVDWHLLMGDETALPAIGRWLEEAPAGTTVIALIEVPSAADRQQIDTVADADIRWLVRDADTEPGRSTLLLDALRALDFPPGRPFAWCAGETLTISPIRRHLRRERGLPKEDVEVVGYWRRSADPVEAPAPTSSSDAGPAPAATAAAPSPRELLLAVHEMSELLPPVALRLAVTLGLPELIAAGTTGERELADACGVPLARLRPLLDALLALGLLRTTPAGLAARSLGEVLLEESAQDHLHLDNPANTLELTLLGALGSLRTGTPVDLPGHGAPLAAARAHDPAVEAALDARTEDTLQWSLQPLAALEPVAHASTVLLLGEGTVPTAIALAGARADRRVHLAVPAASRARIAARLAATPGAVTRIDVLDLDATLPACDAVIAQRALDVLDDAAYTALAARFVHAARAHLVLVSDLADTAAEDDHVAAASLTALAATGTALRTTAEHRRLLTAAGARDVVSSPLGWGFGPSVVTARTAAPETEQGTNAP